MNGENQSEPSDPNGNWQYAPDDSVQTVAPATVSQPVAPEVTWTASEFVAHHKTGGWYAMLVIVALVVGGVVYLMARDIVSMLVVGVTALLFGVAASQKPRVLSYALSHDGMTVGNKFYSYNEFKSFSVVDEGAFSSILFMPLKRFIPPFSIYYDPKDQDKIVATVSVYLPMEPPKNTFIDVLMRQIRF